MKKSFFRIHLISMAIILACLLAGAIPAAAADLPALTCQVGAQDGGNTAVCVQTVGKTNYLFLPAAADLHQLNFCFEGETAVVTGRSGSVTVRSGEAFDLAALFPGTVTDGRYPVTVRLGNRKLSLTVMHSENLSALFLTSASADKDRAWVEQNKENKAKNGGIVLLQADGAVTYDGTMKNIKGRGNSTWGYPKKPYQIKLNEEVDLLQTGIKTEAAETWVLLANYCDETMIHNSVSFDMASRLGLPYTPHFKQVDLYYDGEYRGTYLLCEKTEVGTGRVEITDLEKAYEKSNPRVSDFDALPTETGVNAYGNKFQYVSGLTSPADASGGYLLEIDYADRAKEEKCWFSTTHGSYVTCKSPEYANKAGMTYISELFQRFENAVYNGGVDPVSGKSYAELVDVDSLARVYLMTELSMDVDAFQSSCYFYKRAGETKLYAGPVWDFDAAYEKNSMAGSGDNYLAARAPLGWQLMQIPSFRKAVSDIFIKELSGIVGDITAAGGNGPTLSGYAAEIAASQKMNAALWPEESPRSYADAVEKFRTLLQQRALWMNGVMADLDSALSFRPGFMDVSPDQWFYDAVCYVSEKGFFSGASYIKFSPNEPMTRAMTVIVLHRMAGEPMPEGEAPTFTDVSPDDWYRRAVCWAAANSVTDGCGDGRFAPDTKVTRQDFAVFLYRYAGCPAVESDADAFSDSKSVAPYARDAVQWAVSSGLLEGDGYGRLRPQANVTRAEAAAIIQRYTEQ